MLAVLRSPASTVHLKIENKQQENFVRVKSRRSAIAVVRTRDLYLARSLLYHYTLICIRMQLVRLSYQPPASSTFLSQQTSHQPAVLFSQNKLAPAISHQPNEQAVGSTHTIQHRV
jgi:hypothetical protein